MFELDALNTLHGDVPKMYLVETDPKERKKLGETVSQLLRQGAALLLVAEDKTTQRIYGYDEETNEFVLGGKRKPLPSDATFSSPKELCKLARSRVSASGQKAVAVAQQAGG